MIVLRRFVVISALAFWQGGFAFYAAFVVPIGQEVLGSHVEQGFITRRVTNYLNLAGAVASAVTLWDLYATRSGRAVHRLRFFAWAGMLGPLVFQAWLHGRLDAMLDLVQLDVLDHPRFYAEHRWYLLSSALQLLCCLCFLATSIHSWRYEDAKAGSKESAAG